MTTPRYHRFIIFAAAVALMGWASSVWAAAEKRDNPIMIMKTTMGDVELELFADEAPNTVQNFISLAEGTKEFTDPNTKKKEKRPFYDGLIFHRVIKDFMIQGGCPFGNGTGGPGYRFDDEIDADGLGLDKIPAVDDKTGPHPWLGIRSQGEFQQRILMPMFQAMGITSQEQLNQRKDEARKQLSELTLKKAYEYQGYRYSSAGSDKPPVRGALAMANSGPNTNGSQFFINLKDTDWLSGKHTVFGRVVKGMDVVDKIGNVAVNAQSRPLEPVRIVSLRKK